MSSYFDEAQREVADDFSSIAAVEKRVIRDVLLVTGDREFPDDLREAIVGEIAVYRYETFNDDLPPTRGHDMDEVSRMSHLIERLHERFHELARRGIVTRFGRLSDRPSGILAAREEYEKEMEHGETQS